MYQNKIKVVIFDMDGVLINTESVLKKDEFLFLYKLAQNRWTKKDQRNIRGMSLEGVYDLLRLKFDLMLPKKIFLKKYHQLLENIYQDRVQLNPGVLDILNDVQEKRFKIALASSSSHRFINVVLNRFNLNKYFEIVISADDLKGKGKPYPDIFLETARKLGVEPKDCLVIEDSKNGIIAAKRAGMFCIAYDQDGSIKQYKNLADYSSKDFKEIVKNNLRELLSSINSQNNVLKVVQNDIYLLLSDYVNKSDYYSDFLLSELNKLIPKLSNKPLRLLEMGTGRGYLSIALAKKNNNITRIVATDIELHSISLATKNVFLNNLEDKIKVRDPADLFDKIKKNEKFDLIFGALPQIPITKKGVLGLKDNIAPYHITTSSGGNDGQKIITKLILQASSFLKPKGYLAFVQAEFSNPEKTLQTIQRAGFKNYFIKKKKKLLKETTLTKMIRENLEKKGYKFKKDNNGEEYFNLLTIIAQM